MIKSELEFNQAIEQLERMYRALAALRSRRDTMSEQQFRVMTEGPQEELRRLQTELDSYLDISVETHQ